ncbi:MAG: hypothetical protein JWP36_2392 [Paucimonas sp.]|nr:hypothetical protein [Paucimonas sp.]
MKLLSYSLRGIASWGCIVDGKVIDLKAESKFRVPTLVGALRQYSLPELEELASRAKPAGCEDEIEYLPVINEASKIFCVGVNYEDHRVESDKPQTGSPPIFTRFSSSQVGHRQPLILPPESERFDYEGEIAVIIGRAGRRIAQADAWDYIAGYSCYNDGSLRDWQNHTSQWTPGKNFAGTGGFGPWMVTRGEIEDGQVLELTTRLNGKVMQNAKTDQLIFSIPSIISYISTFSPLEPGDVIVTGTPGGVGSKRTPPVFMRDGDTVEIEVSGIGILSNRVRAEQA